MIDLNAIAARIELDFEGKEDRYATPDADYNIKEIRFALESIVRECARVGSEYYGSADAILAHFGLTQEKIHE